MKIECLDTFLDGVDRFEKGDVRTVGDDRGAYFCSSGWAKCLGDVAPIGVQDPEPATLNVKGSVIGTGDSNG